MFRDGGRSVVGVARAGSLNRGSNQISGEARDGAFALHTSCSLIGSLLCSHTISSLELAVGPGGPVSSHIAQ